MDDCIKNEIIGHDRIRKWILAWQWILHGPTIALERLETGWRSEGKGGEGKKLILTMTVSRSLRSLRTTPRSKSGSIREWSRKVNAAANFE